MFISNSSQNIHFLLILVFQKIYSLLKLVLKANELRKEIFQRELF